MSAPAHSIQQRLALRLVLFTFLMVIAAGTALYVYVRAALWRQFDAALEIKARGLASFAKLEVKQDAPRLEFEYQAAAMPEFSRAEHPEFFQITREDGSSVARSPSLPAGVSLATSGAANRMVSFWTAPLPSGAPGRAVRIRFTPLVEDEEGHGIAAAAAAAAVPPTLLLTLARPSREVDRPLQVLLSSLLAAATLIGAGTLAGVAWTVRRGLRPLRALADAAAAVDVQSLSYRFPTAEMPREVQPICMRLNDLLARLDESFQRERRFSAAVAHELRTPIAELRSLAEVALRWPGEGDGASQHAFDSLAIAQQMGTIVSTLLSLARAQSGRQLVAREPLDVAAAMRNAWQPFEPAAQSRNLQVELNVTGPAESPTDAQLLIAICSNLFANASTYTPNGGRIAITLESHPNRLQIRVANTNDSLEPTDLSRLFEPFWRKDASRTGSDHSGLGLALVKALADALGADVSADLPSANWFEVTLSLNSSRSADSSVFVNAGSPSP
jgi:heavy metal sensor kinase